MAKAPATAGEGSAHEKNPSPFGLRAMVRPQLKTSPVSRGDFLAYKALHTHSTRGGRVAAPPLRGTCRVGTRPATLEEPQEVLPPGGLL